MNENGMIEEEDVFGNSVVSCYRDGYLHRVDGPARYYYSTGREEWWRNGKPHREDGPAIILSDGHKKWYLDGVLLTKDQWWERIPDECKLKILFDEYKLKNTF
jgi:hypothetical protein